MGFLELNPSELLDAARTHNDDLDTQVMDVLKSQVTAHYSDGSKKLMVSSLRSFLLRRKLKLELLGLRFKRFHARKELFRWSEAEKVIDCATPPWRNCYRVMLWSTFDNQRFIDVNQDVERIAKVKKDLEDSTRQWIRIEVPDGRKQSPPFTVTIPREVASLLPVLMNDGSPVRSRQLLIRHFRQALVRAGFGDRHRFGTHQLRSCWKSEATHRGLPSVISEAQLGHEVDALNYERMHDDSDWVLSEFSKAWSVPQAATTNELADLRKEVQQLRDAIRLEHDARFGDVTKPRQILPT
jgi:hypothetical protein